MAYVNIKREPKVESEMEVAIRDRLLNGFANWNGGYDAWLEWCNTLYEPDAHYNVYGKRMTLQEYKDMMGLLFKKYTMILGDFENMFIQDNWCAIRYSVTIKDLKSGKEYPQQTMEFVEFKDNPDPIGVRVVEGWALSDSPLSEDQSFIDKLLEKFAMNMIAKKNKN